MSIPARSFTYLFGRSPCPGQLPSSLRLPLSGRPPVVSKLLLHVLFCFTIRFSRYHAVRSAFRFPAAAPLLYHPSSPLSTLFSLPRLPRLFSIFSFVLLNIASIIFTSLLLVLNCCSDIFAFNNSNDIIGIVKIENDYRHIVILAKRKCR